MGLKIWYLHIFCTLESMTVISAMFIRSITYKIYCSKPSRNMPLKIIGQNVACQGDDSFKNFVVFRQLMN
jgi:hypothetical protein